MARAPTNLRVMNSLVALVCGKRVLESERESYHRRWAVLVEAEASQWCLRPWSLGLVGEGAGDGWVFFGES